MTLGTKGVTHALGKTRLALISATTFYGDGAGDPGAGSSPPVSPLLERDQLALQIS